MQAPYFSLRSLTVIDQINLKMQQIS